MPEKKRKPRSPAYPALPLEEAVRRARLLYDHEKQYPSTVEAVAKSWGHSSGKSGSTLAAIACLRYYGLLSEQKGGEERIVRLTDLALTILLEPPDSPQRIEAVRQAALMPKVHRELMDLYPQGLPSDASLRSELIRNRGFTQNAVPSFIENLRATLEYADIEPGGANPSDTDVAIATEAEEEEAAAVDVAAPSPAPALPPVVSRRPPPAEGGIDVKSWSIPLLGGHAATLSLPWPVEQQDIELVKGWLDAMTPALVRDHEGRGS